MLKSFFRGLIHVFLPRYCAVCDEELMDDEECVCNACLFKLHPVEWGKTDDNPLLRQLWDRVDVEAGGCSLFYRTSSDFHNIFMLTKYHGRPDVGRTVTRKSFPYWKNLGLVDGVDCIIPVPLHWTRRLSRGYNQAEWIAKGVVDVEKLPIKTDVLRRRHYNRSQVRKKALERRCDLQNQFVAKPGKGLDGKTVLLVDDICTTGSTLADCIRALREVYPTVKVRAFTLGWAGR